MTGFRATVVIRDPDGCPVADVSARADEPVVEVLGVTADAAVDGGAGVDVTPVWTAGRGTIYRFERGEAADCACEIVEALSQGCEDASADPVVVDRNELTARQLEVVNTAHEMGYFDYPKGANATDVADELGIARSTFTEHLAAAQTKLMDAILEQ
ncbi:helix-turn-helix domain-containing protein [Natrinema sp. 74]|uniref:helix-turn-helix domain-containing protein n=1 Tax=Natrinema sp. 74 TaxID=3384159 RepID=UPI0038D3B272